MTGETVDRDGPPVQVRDGQIRVVRRADDAARRGSQTLLLASLPTDGSMARLDLAQVSEIDTAGIAAADGGEP